MNENLNPVNNLQPFLNYCYTVGMLPTSYKVSMTYEEQVLEAIRYIKEEIIPTVNINALATTELQEKFVELVNFVETYFDNLDVQEEVNIKIDEMAEDGTLEELITPLVANSKVDKSKLGFAQDDDYFIGLGQPIFIDNLNGNDENDGLTAGTPLKTIKGAFTKYVNAGDMNPNLYLMSGQTHDFPFFNIIAMTIHFSCYGGTAPATINFSNTYMAFYNSHLNFHGTQDRPLRITGTEFYMDGGTFLFSYCDIETKFSSNGADGHFLYSTTYTVTQLNYCNVRIESTHLNRCQAFNSNISLQACTFLTNSTSSWDCTFDFICCTTIIMGLTYINLSNPITTGSIFKLTGGQFTLNAVINNLNNDSGRYRYGFTVSGGLLISTNQRLNALTNIAATNYQLSNGGFVNAV